MLADNTIVYFHQIKAIFSIAGYTVRTACFTVPFLFELIAWIEGRMATRVDISKTDFFVSLGVFLLFTVSYKVNEYFDSFMLFAAGVSLIYIPAGVKLLSLLIGGIPAFIGLFISSLYLNLLLWQTLTLNSATYFAAIGVGSYALAVYLCRRSLMIKDDLSNLNYWHIIVLSITASLFNGFGQNFVYFTQGVTAGDEIFSKSTAMAFGDFFGCFLIVMLFNIGIRLAKKYRRA